MTEVSYGIAFGAGIVSFFSPCIIPMIPAYISFISGVAANDKGHHWLKPFIRTTGFVLGFSLVFILLGASASSIGRLLMFHMFWLRRISGIMIIVFGLFMLNILKIKFLQRQKQFKLPKLMDSYTGSFLMGITFGAGWTPCIGAVLASILFFAGTQDTLMQGMFLLGFYALGLSIPFLLASLFIGRFTERLGQFEKFSTYANRFAGVMLVILGILIYTNQLVYLTALFT